jgi:uncharacterized protein (TIGR02594 family)
MFNLKIATLAGAFLFAFAMGSAAEAAKIKKRAGVTYSCTIHKNGYERCVAIKKKRVVKRRTNTQTRNATPPQAEWPVSYDTSHIHSVASRFVGLHERSNRSTLKAVVRVDPAITAWCAAFVNAMLHKVGVQGTGSNQARSFLRYGVATRNPRKGDIVVLGRHVGFYGGHVTRNGRTYVAVLGGNQSNRVQTSYFLASRVLSYRRVA